MTTTFDVLVAMAQRLPGTVRGVATDGGYGTYTYLDDTNQLTAYVDDAWNGGTLLIETGTLAGAVLVVTDSIQATGRLALNGLLWELNATDTPAAGARYTLVNSAWPVGVLLAAADEALRQWGKVETEVQLGTGDGETEAFDLPTGTTGDIVRVYLVNEDMDIRVDCQNWEETTTGMVFEDAPASDWTVWAVVVDWETLSDLPGYGLEEELAALETEGSGSVSLLTGTAICQTFTIAAQYRITTLKLYIDNYYGGAALTIPVEIWGTLAGGDTDGYPDTEDVLYTTTGTIAAATEDWMEISVDDTVLILEPGLYTLVAKEATGGAGLWHYSDDPYANGAAYSVTLSGPVYSTLVNDFMFEVSGRDVVLRGASAVWPEAVPVEFGAWYGAYALLRGRVGIPGHDQDGMVQLMNYALERAEGERRRCNQVGVRARERFFRG